MGSNLRQVQGHDVHPFMSAARRTDLARASDGVGVHSGFQVNITSPVSKSVDISKGLIVAPTGKEIRFVNPQSSASSAAQFTAGSAPFTRFDLTDAIAAAVLASHDTLVLSVDWQTESLVVTSETAANVATQVTTPISGGGDAVPEYVRPVATVTHPETFASVANAVTRIVIATATISGGNITAVDNANKERRQPFADMLQ